MAFDREGAKAAGYTDEEIDQYLVSQGLGSEARATSPQVATVTYSRTGVPTGPGGAEMPYQGPADTGVEKPAFYQDPVELPGVILAGPAGAARSALTGSIASRIGGAAVPSLARHAGEFALEEAGGLPARIAMRLGKVFGRGAETAPASADVAANARQVLGKPFNRFAQQAEEEAAGKARTAIKQAERSMTPSERRGLEAAKRVKSKPAEGLAEEAKPKVKPSRPKKVKTPTQSRAMSAQEQAAARAKGRSIQPTKSPNAMQGASGPKLARRAAALEKSAAEGGHMTAEQGNQILERLSRVEDAMSGRPNLSLVPPQEQDLTDLLLRSIEAVRAARGQ